MNIVIREWKDGEQALLEDFLYEAIFIPEGVEAPPREIIQLPELQVYITEFGEKPDDICFLAEADGKVAGAVWVRVVEDYGHLEDGVPSFAISLYKEYRDLGIGTALMKRMLCELKERGYEKASLAVQKENFAVKMYQKVGFEIVGENEEEYLMMWKRRKEMNFDINKLEWTREPEKYFISEDKIEIITKPHTDLWQRTYYHFRNDNAPVLQLSTDEKFFSFTVKTEFESKHRFDQCGVVMYLDSENWLKGSIEYDNEEFQHLGSVVTNNGYSDWATTAIDASIKSMWYRFSRREDDYCIECSADGIHFSQMRICHMWNGKGTIQFGIYACSPEDSSFKATFTNFEMTECKWLAHDGQAPDEEDLYI